MSKSRFISIFVLLSVLNLLFGCSNFKQETVGTRLTLEKEKSVIDMFNITKIVEKYETGIGSEGAEEIKETPKGFVSGAVRVVIGYNENGEKVKLFIDANNNDNPQETAFIIMQEEKEINAPSIEEVKEAYERANEAFTWFKVTTLPFESSMKEVDGWIYNKVNHDFIKNYADLENYLQSLFTQNIVDELLNTEFKQYRDIDGELYVVSADGGTDIYKGDATLEVQLENDVKFKCIVEVELLGEDYEVIGYETHEFSYELIEGQWIFTNFYFFY